MDAVFEPQSRARINVSVLDDLESKVDVRFVERVVGVVIGQEGPFDDVELTVRITGDDEIRTLNRQFRRVDHATDVLSFGSHDDADEYQRGNDPTTENDAIILPGEVPDQLGDVVVNHSASIRQAQEFGHSQEREFAWLIIHGVLQLIGYRHDTPSRAWAMRRRERLALRTLGLSRASEVDDRPPANTDDIGTWTD
jgi:probable rRNA maturation factor